VFEPQAGEERIVTAGRIEIRRVDWECPEADPLHRLDDLHSLVSRHRATPIHEAETPGDASMR
jgi:hypothetical protein